MVAALGWTPNKGSYIEHVYIRGDLNSDLPPNIKAADAAGWIPGVAADYHNIGTSGNVKYVSPDGKREAIYDLNENLVTDPTNMGTYNYANPIDNIIGHIFYDVFPYFYYGNGPGDTTNYIIQRILAPILK